MQANDNILRPKENLEVKHLEHNSKIFALIMFVSHSGENHLKLPKLKGSLFSINPCLSII